MKTIYKIHLEGYAASPYYKNFFFLEKIQKTSIHGVNPYGEPNRFEQEDERGKGTTPITTQEIGKGRIQEPSLRRRPKPNQPIECSPIG